MISSAQNPKIKLVRALAGRAKERREAGAFLAEGVRLVEEALAAGWPFRFVLYSEELSPRGRELLEKLEAQKMDVEQVESRLLQSLSETETSQGLLAVLDDSQLPLPAGGRLPAHPGCDPRPGQPGHAAAQRACGGSAGRAALTRDRGCASRPRWCGQAWARTSACPYAR